MGPVHRANKLRIIGGSWRSRTLAFPDIAELRPTPDRVRETLFNWLQNDIAGARCLDLFAGSGALGLEALSRGASHVTFVDHHRAAVCQLRENLRLLEAEALASVIESSASQYLTSPAQTFDVVFLDPPYRFSGLASVCVTLENEGWLRDDALIYLENAGADPPPHIPTTWKLLKSKQAGEVRYSLACRDAPHEETL